MDLLIAPNTVSLAEADTAPTTGTPGYATDGNPTTGSPRTPFPAYAWNAMQIEVTTVITKAGLALNRDDNTLLYQAIQKLVAEGEAEAAVGYTPVEQGGTNGLASDKINIGNSGNGLSAYIAGDLWGVFASQAWANGLFSTIAQLQSETQRATTVESNLQSGKVAKSGDEMDGGLNIKSGSGLTVTFDPGGQTTGQITNYAGITSVAGARGGTFGFYVQELVGTTFSGVFSLGFPDGSYRFLSIPGNSDRLHDSTYGDVAYTSDLQNYVPSSEISSGTIDNGYYTKIGNILRQTFDVTLTPDSNGNATITFPQAYSSPPKVIGMGSVETTQNHSAITLNQTNSSGVLTSATQAFLHFSTGANTSSVQQSVVNITVEGIA